MSSFRDQLGEDWLRYQHHLDGASSSAVITTVPANQSPRQTLTNGFSTSTPCPSSSSGKQQPSPPSLEVPEVLQSPLFPSEPRTETSGADGDEDTESTLQWLAQSTRNTESTLEDSTVDGQGDNQGDRNSPEPSPESHRPERAESRGAKEEEEEEEDLGGRIQGSYETELQFDSFYT